MIDGSGGGPRAGDVAIAGGLFVDPDAVTGPDVAEIEVGGRTIMPGLVDAHVHLCSGIATGLRPYALAKAARDMLDGGITTVRDLGSYGREVFDLRDAIDAGYAPGPRIVLCGQIVAATSPGAAAFAGMYREADGVDEVRKAVREQVRQGADLIKVMTTGALTVPLEDVHPSQMTDEELAALVEEAHRSGFKVASHAEGADGIRQSVAAGVDTVEHGDMGYLVPDALAAMAERGIVLVPTLSVFDAVADPDGGFAEWMQERAKRLGEGARKTVTAARTAGVAIAMGADAGPHGANARELAKLTDAGLTNAEALAAGTTVAAEACGLGGTIGVIAPGHAADVLVVDGDPLTDISVLCAATRRWLVLHNGSPVAGTAVEQFRGALERSVG
ncbi:MAG TPA: amidohydrolase family protein [Gaiellales bacterium]|nr:amidohydrolase family protein [Gaiellales bacterium]